jgi:hypothetical protein
MNTELEFTVPPDISFPQAIGLTQQILSIPPEDDLLEPALTALLQTENGGRGFFVTFLGSDSPLADQPSAGLLRALRSAPTIVADLMTKNLAMSTAMELYHHHNGDFEHASGSSRVRARSCQLIQKLQLPELQTNLQLLLESTINQTGEYQAFLDRWGYDESQRQAIRATLEMVLAGNMTDT